MEKVTSKDLQRKYGQIRKQALEGGVMVTHHGHDELALIPAEVYKRLVAMNLRSHAVEDLPPEVINGMDQEPLSADAYTFEHEYPG